MSKAKISINSKISHLNESTNKTHIFSEVFINTKIANL